MTENQIDQLIGRLNAIELLLAQTLTVAVSHMDNKNAFINDMKVALSERKDRLSENQYKYAEDCFERITSSVIDSIK